MARITSEDLKNKVIAINRGMGLRFGEIGSLHLKRKHTNTDCKYAVGLIMPNDMFIAYTGENNWVSATACMMFLEGYEKGFCRGCLNK